jgi:hypothetical protein
MKPPHLDALIAIRTECPDAKVIVLTTYEGDVSKLDANDRTHAVTIGLKRGIIEQ